MDTKKMQRHCFKTFINYLTKTNYNGKTKTLIFSKKK